MNKLIISIVLIVVIIAVLVIGGAIIWTKFIRHEGKITSIVSVESIKKIAQLATVEYNISQFHHETKKREWYEWLDASFFVIVKAKVTGSVDLKKTTIDIDHENKIVKIKFLMDAIMIHDPEIGEDGITLIKCSDPNIFHPINEADWQKAQNAAIANIKKTVLEDGIKTKTAVEAKIVLTNFLTALGYDAQIEFEDKSIQAAVGGIFFNQSTSQQTTANFCSRLLPI